MVSKSDDFTKGPNCKRRHIPLGRFGGKGAEKFEKYYLSMKII